MKLTLERDLDDGTCTLGVLSLNGKTWQTIERPWIAGLLPGGLAGRSCVPVGHYELELHDSEAHPETWALVNPSLGVVHFPPGPRSACLIHPANYAHELRGCIAPGLVRATQAVFNSREAFAQLKTALPWRSGHTLEIKGPA